MLTQGMAMTKKPTIVVDVKRRALLARVKRALAKRGHELTFDLSNRMSNVMILDTEKQVILDSNVDLEKLARELGVLKPWEKLAE